MAPPMTMTPGLNMFTRAEMVSPATRADFWMRVMARGSPAWAARVISSRVSAPFFASGARELRVPSLIACFGIPDQGPAAGHRFQAADLAAAALGIGVGNPDVADVAGRAVGTAVDPALGQQAGSDSRTDLAVDEVREGFATPGALAKGKQVDVVIHPHRCVEAVLEGRADIESVPPRHDRRRHRLPRGEVNRAGKAHHHAPDGHLVILLQHVVNEGHHRVNGLLRALGDIPGAVRVFQDVAVEGS